MEQTGVRGLGSGRECHDKIPHLLNVLLDALVSLAASELSLPFSFSSLVIPTRIFLIWRPPVPPKKLLLDRRFPPSSSSSSSSYPDARHLHVHTRRCTRIRGGIHKACRRREGGREAGRDRERVRDGVRNGVRDGVSERGRERRRERGRERRKGSSAASRIWM